MSRRNRGEEREDTAYGKGDRRDVKEREAEPAR